MNYDLSAAESLNTAVAGVLARMAGGVAVTMLLAAVLSGLGLAPLLFSGVFGWIIVFAPLAMSLYLMWRGSELSESGIKAWFWAFSSVFGLSLSLLFTVYTSASIAQALVGATVSFSALAGWGYFTRRDLSSWAPFLFAGVIGLIVAGLFNIWFDSTALQMTLNVLTIVIFLGMTAWDMNRIRDEFWSASESDVGRLQWFGALSLYINFINIFVSLLQLLGDRE